VLAPLAMVRRLASSMCERGGRIVFVTSTWVKQPHPGRVLSGAARSSISALAKQLALELGDGGVLVHQVMPGPTWTDRSKQIVGSLAAARSVSEDSIRAEVMRTRPLNRYGRPEEIAAVIAFLASERASFATGTASAVHGGLVKAVL
jgi:3-oxoacyl-[acyl-carrier protein] reductase